VSEQPTPTTAVLKIEPKTDKVVRVLYAEGMRMLEVAQNMVIDSEEAVRRASKELGLIKQRKDAMELERTGYTKPMGDHLRVINAAFKELAAPINADKAQLARDEVALMGGAEPVVPVEVMAAPKSVHRDGLTTVGTAKNMRWRLIDFSLVPDHYKKLNETEITRLVKGGGTIEGIQVYDEPILKVNTATPMPQERPQPLAQELDPPAEVSGGAYEPPF